MRAGGSLFIIHYYKLIHVFNHSKKLNDTKEALYGRLLNSSHAHATRRFYAKHGHVTERDVTSRKCI